MPSNPIQRKTRNAFLLGMLIMLIVAVVLIAILYFFVFSEQGAGSSKTGGTSYAYVVSTEIKSGETINVNNIQKVKVSVSSIPENYFTDADGVAEEKYKTKVDLQPGTVLSNSLLYTGEGLENSARLIEYNMLTLPSTLRVGDYIDVRLTMPSGQNYIVLSKKQVMSINNTTVTLQLTEDEILMMSGAIVESYIMKASNLHAIKYIEAGMQDASTPTYVISSEVYELIRSNASKINIEDYSKINSSLTGSENLRALIDAELGQYTGSETTNIQDGMDKEKETAMELYLSGLQGY